ncbi:MAG: pyridoxal 5'-phosphate synthase glutaminase subunit PdxT [Chloroflexaceae bacterium]|nr:pyridoxal 5'-phosphate synthase glutaminase subunit PdxT [Chloroflexaceae bacterium]
MTIGVLALQGDFREHEEVLKRIGAPVQQVRLPKHLDLVDRLIIPGGESTTIGRLLVLYNLLEPIRQRAGRSLAVWGTCAGAILLSRRILDGKPEQPALELMDTVVRRNAFGRQLDSFETKLDMPVLGEAPMPGVFIRAPIIESVGKDVHVMSELNDGTIVAAQQGRLLATTFHPELTDDDRLHRYFLEL